MVGSITCSCTYLLEGREHKAENFAMTVLLLTEFVYAEVRDFAKGSLVFNRIMA